MTGVARGNQVIMPNEVAGAYDPSVIAACVGFAGNLFNSMPGGPLEAACDPAFQDYAFDGRGGVSRVSANRDEFLEYRRRGDHFRLTGITQVFLHPDNAPYVPGTRQRYTAGAIMELTMVQKDPVPLADGSGFVPVPEHPDENPIRVQVEEWWLLGRAAFEGRMWRTLAAANPRAMVEGQLLERDLPERQRTKLLNPMQHYSKDFPRGWRRPDLLLP